MVNIIVWTTAIITSLCLFLIPFWANGYLIPYTLFDFIKTWRPKFYEIPGYIHHIRIGEGHYDPEIRFVVKYRRGYYILDREMKEWIWKRPVMVGVLAVEKHIKPIDQLKMLVLTGLEWKKEKKHIKRLRYKDLPLIHGFESVIWYGGIYETGDNS